MYFIILVDKFWSIETSGLNELLNLIMVSLIHLFEVQSLKALLYINFTIIFLYICCIFVFYSLDAKSWMFTDDAEWPGQPRSCRGWQKNKLDCELPSSDHDPGGNADSLSNYFWLIINLFVRRRLGHCFLPSERLRVASWSETKSLDRV